MAESALMPCRQRGPHSLRLGLFTIHNNMGEPFVLLWLEYEWACVGVYAQGGGICMEPRNFHDLYKGLRQVLPLGGRLLWVPLGCIDCCNVAEEQQRKEARGSRPHLQVSAVYVFL